MLIRKLVSLYEQPKGQWYIDFGYYEPDEFSNLRWTGKSEDARLSEEELYQLLKPKLQTRIH